MMMDILYLSVILKHAVNLTWASEELPSKVVCFRPYFIGENIFPFKAYFIIAEIVKVPFAGRWNPV